MVVVPKKGPRKKGHSNRHITCGKVCKRSRIHVADGRVYVPALPPGIRRAGEELLQTRKRRSG